MSAEKDLEKGNWSRKVKVPEFMPEKSLLDFPYKGRPVFNRNRKHAVGQSISTCNYRGKEVKQKTNTIGVVVHTLQSEFIKSALTGMREITGNLGYEMVIMQSQEKMEREVANANMLFDQQVDGLIASLSFGTSDLNHFRRFEKKNIPVVFFDRVDAVAENRTVVIDNVYAGYLAASHLIQQGCKRIAIVTSCLNRNVYADRYKGFLNALGDHGLPFYDNMLIVKDLTVEAGMEAALQIMAMPEKPDALFITNDLVAAACMRTLMEKGIKVPEDVAVVGFNNDSICRLTVPAISTINYPGMEMGRLAAMQLINAITGRNVFTLKETTGIPVQLIVRSSSLK